MNFFVVEDDVAVTLSGSVAEQLGLLRRVAAVEQPELYEVAKPYDDGFNGLGMLTGVIYHMKLKLEAEGVIRPARRIPIALQEKTKAELDRMEAAQVIQNVKANGVV